MSEMLSTITMVIIIWFGGEMVLNKTFDAEAFIGFYNYVLSNYTSS